MFKVDVKSNLSVPTLLLKKDLEYIADRIIIPHLQRGIHNQVQIDNTPFPALEPKTIQRKTGAILKSTFTKKGNIRPAAIKKVGAGGLTGFSSKTLIETGALVASFIRKSGSKDTVTVTMTSNRKDIGKYLQIDGVGKKKKKFLFFGVSDIMESQAMSYIRKRIKDEISKRKT